MKVICFVFIFLLTLSCNKISNEIHAKRYEYHPDSQYPAQSVLLDTHTGKMWSKTCFSEIKNGDCEVKAWAPIDIIDITVSEKDVWKAVENLEKSKKGN